jgi:hypothetical protein
MIKKLRTFIRQRKIITSIVIASSLLIGIVGSIWTFMPKDKVQAAPSYGEILFIHGIAGGHPKGSSIGVPGGCSGTWNTAINYIQPRMQQAGWSGYTRTIGYYGDETGTCDVLLSDSLYVPAAPRCQGINTGTVGTNDEDLRYIACKLAWYIYDNDTTAGKNVRIVAHSMGGIIVRWMIHVISDTNNPFHNVFPPYLDIPIVYTIATPHGGAPDFWGDPASQIVCGGCLQGKQLVSSDIITQLKSETTPQGSNGTGSTDWNLMSSQCDDWTMPGVRSDAAMNFPGGHKTLYKNVITQNNDHCQIGDDTAVKSYTHGGYLQDTIEATDATATYCDNCTAMPTNSISTRHSLQVVLEALKKGLPTSTNMPSAPAGYQTAWPQNLTQGVGCSNLIHTDNGVWFSDL